MKLPKLKYYYLGLTDQQYQEFKLTRRIHMGPVTIDVITGRIQGQSQVSLWPQAPQADQHVRDQSPTGPVYVLRIPRDHIQTQHVRGTDSAQLLYDRDLVIPHCGVERFDLVPQ